MGPQSASKTMISLFEFCYLCLSFIFNAYYFIIFILYLLFHLSIRIYSFKIFLYIGTSKIILPNLHDRSTSEIGLYKLIFVDRPARSYKLLFIARPPDRSL